MVDGNLKTDHRAFAELSGALVNELLTELDTIRRGKAWKELSQSERRMIVRVTFATIEAAIYVFKQFALAADFEPNGPTISEAERGFAVEREFKLMPSGDVEQRAAKISLETNIRFTFKLLVKASKAPLALDISGPQWQSLQRAIKVRDRITHPKNISDLTISDAEFPDVIVGFKWLVASLAKLGKILGDSLLKRCDDLED